MQDELRYAIQEAFAETHTIPDLAKIYAEIQVECDRQLEFMAGIIKKEEKDNTE